MKSSTDPRTNWPPLLALGLLLAAGIVLVVQQQLYRDEHAAYLERERACSACTSSPTE